MGTRLRADPDFAPTSLQRKGTAVGWKETLHTETSGLGRAVGGGLYTSHSSSPQPYHVHAIVPILQKRKEAQQGNVSYTNW